MHAEAALNGVARTCIHDIGIGGSDLNGSDAVDALLLVEDGVDLHVEVAADVRVSVARVRSRSQERGAAAI